MPAKSEAQRRLMAAARAYKRGEYKGEPSEEVKRLADSMSDKELSGYMHKEARNFNPDPSDPDMQRQYDDLAAERFYKQVKDLRKAYVSERGKAQGEKGSSGTLAQVPNAISDIVGVDPAKARPGLGKMLAAVGKANQNPGGIQLAGRTRMTQAPRPQPIPQTTSDDKVMPRPVKDATKVAGWAFSKIFGKGLGPAPGTNSQYLKKRRLNELAAEVGERTTEGTMAQIPGAAAEVAGTIKDYGLYGGGKLAEVLTGIKHPEMNRLEKKLGKDKKEQTAMRKEGEDTLYKVAAMPQFWQKLQSFRQMPESTLGWMQKMLQKGKPAAKEAPTAMGNLGLTAYRDTLLGKKGLKPAPITSMPKLAAEKDDLMSSSNEAMRQMFVQGVQEQYGAAPEEMEELMQYMKDNKILYFTEDNKPVHEGTSYDEVHNPEEGSYYHSKAAAINKVAEIIKHASSCRSKSARAQNRAAHAAKIKKGERQQTSIEKLAALGFGVEGDIKEATTPIRHSLGNVEADVLVTRQGVQNIDKRLKDIHDLIEKWQAAGLDPEVIEALAPSPIAGAAVGTGGGLLLTKLLHKDPDALDYAIGGGVGGVVGALGTAAGKEYGKRVAKAVSKSLGKLAVENPSGPGYVIQDIDAAVAKLHKEAGNPLRWLKGAPKLLGDTPLEKIWRTGALGAGGTLGTLQYKNQPEGDRSIVPAAITGLGTAWTLDPSYIRQLRKGVARAKKKGGDVQFPVASRLGTSAALAGGPTAYQRIMGTMEDARGTMKQLNTGTGKAQMSAQALYDASQALKELVELMKDPAKKFTESVTSAPKRAVDWSKKHPKELALAGGGVLTAAVLYKMYNDRQRRKEVEEEANIQAEAMRRALR